VGSDNATMAWVGRAYLEHFTRDDLMVLATAARVTSEPNVSADRILARRPQIIEDALGDPRTFAAIFGDERDSWLRASPFCVFAACVQHARADLARTRVDEWVGDRRRLPVLGAHLLERGSMCPSIACSSLSCARRTPTSRAGRCTSTGFNDRENRDLLLQGRPETDGLHLRRRSRQRLIAASGQASGSLR
jgi:hypothetical protein